MQQLKELNYLIKYEETKVQEQRIFSFSFFKIGFSKKYLLTNLSIISKYINKLPKIPIVLLKNFKSLPWFFFHFPQGFAQKRTGPRQLASHLKLILTWLINFNLLQTTFSNIWIFCCHSTHPPDLARFQYIINAPIQSNHGQTRYRKEERLSFCDRERH